MCESTSSWWTKFIVAQNKVIPELVEIICCPIGGYSTLHANHFPVHSCAFIGIGQTKAAWMKNSFQFDIVHCDVKLAGSITTISNNMRPLNNNHEVISNLHSFSAARNVWWIAVLDRHQPIEFNWCSAKLWTRYARNAKTVVLCSVVWDQNAWEAPSSLLCMKFLIPARRDANIYLHKFPAGVLQT